MDTIRRTERDNKEAYKLSTNFMSAIALKFILFHKEKKERESNVYLFLKSWWF